MNIIAMIPARMGSERLPMKNLALLNGQPLISYAIEAAKNSGVFSRVVVNSDGVAFHSVAQRYGVEFYLRPQALGSSETKSDDVVYDFMLKHPSDIVAWVNPISPLQTGEEVRKVIDYFITQQLDSLITVKNEQLHCVYESKPLNFTPNGLFAKTQDLTPVQYFVYSVMMWRTQTFVGTYKKQGYALLSGKLGYFPVSKESAVIIKTDEDLMIAESILKARAGGRAYEVLYDKLATVSG
jgi:CMP-N-acetylneuraminic acid synthetase